MNSRIEKALSTTLTLSALAMVLLVIRRELVPASATSQAPASIYVEDWKRLESIGTEIGTPGAPVKIVEFLDLQCPACRAYHKSELERFRSSFGIENYSHLVVHFPLSSHPFAIAAANAAECAKAQGRFKEFVDVSLSDQRNFGTRSWTSYAVEAGVSDTVAFSRCHVDSAPALPVEKGRALAIDLNVDGTPTFLVNGWMMNVPPTAEQLSREVKRLKSRD